MADPPYAFGGRRSEWRITANVAIGLAAAARRVRKGGAMAVMTAASGHGMDFAFGAVGPVLPFNRLLVWTKTSVNTPVGGPWRWDIVPVLVFGPGTFGRPSASAYYVSDGHRAGMTGHPAELPVGLGRWLVEPFEGTVLDPFAGLGTFIVAARELGRRAIRVEIEERYCELAATRILQATLGLPAPR